MTKNITMIGGGSSSFVPPLLRRLIESPVLHDSQLTLMDVDAERLDVMARLGGKVVESEHSPLRVRATTDMREALTDADFVISAISVGGMTAWEQDMEIPGRYGVVMHVADSIGPGGIMRTLRNAPISRDIAQIVSEVAAPGAWIFNYTNPTAVEGMAMRTVPGVNVVSLCSCNVHVKSPDWLAEQTGVSPEEIAMPPVVGGLNHCAGVMDLRLRDGRDGLELARDTVTNEVMQWALRMYGMLPYCWSHWTEFHPGMQRLDEPYAGTAQGIGMKYGIRTHDMDEQRARPEELAALAATWTAPDAEVHLSDLPMGDEDEGVEVVDIIESMVAHRPHSYVVNVPNHGAIPNLPDDAVVEVTARIDAYGVRPVYAGPLPDALAALLRSYVALQRQMVKAALSGDRDDVYRALLLDPTTQSILDIDEIGAMCDELLAANAQWLPAFDKAAASAGNP